MANPPFWIWVIVIICLLLTWDLYRDRVKFKKWKKEQREKEAKEERIQEEEWRKVDEEANKYCGTCDLYQDPCDVNCITDGPCEYYISEGTRPGATVGVYRRKRNVV